jgi:outer membrane phospholipase A
MKHLPNFPAALLAASVLLPFQAQAREDVEILIRNVDERDANGFALVDIRLLNSDDAAQTVPLPDRIEARVTLPGGTHSVWLDRGPTVPAQVIVAAHGFACAQYRVSDASVNQGALLSVPAWGRQQIALSARHGLMPDQPGEQAQATVPVPPPTPSAADRSVGNAFIDNLSPYEPIYAVYGPGTNSEARIQLSFKYQLFGSRLREDQPASLKDGLYFAYTQHMFWDLGADSSPFRNIDFQPEIFYLAQPKALSDTATLSGQVGLRHESNGRDGDASRSINMVYVTPMAAFSLGGDWRLTAAPRFWLYVGDRSDNRDIRRYRGNSGFFMEVAEVNGLRLSTSTRFNFGSGKGAVSADISYPLRRILGDGPDFYLFGQSFHGYGENLLDYNKRATRLRIGVALVR